MTIAKTQTTPVTGARRERLLMACSWAPGSMGYGGTPPTAGAYLTALEGAGYDISYLCSDASFDRPVTQAAFRQRYPFVKPLLFRASRPGWGLGPGLLKHIPAILLADRILVHNILGAPSMLTMILCALRRKSFVLTPHASLDSSRLKGIAERRPRLYAGLVFVMKRLLRNASALAVTGVGERDALEAWVDKSKAVFVENFLAFDLDAPIAAPAGLRRFVYAGRLEPDKGIKRFLEVWLRSAAPDSRLDLVGSGRSEYARAVEAMAASDSRVTLHGELTREATMEIMSRGNIVVLPTGLDLNVTENFGNVILESLIEGRLGMVTAGLHWDTFAPNPALFIFDKTDESVAAEIRRFEALDEKALAKAAVAARQLASKFHVSVAAPKVKALFNPAD